MKKIVCSRCGNDNLEKFKDIYMCTPSSKKPLKECVFCGKQNDYYEVFGRSVGQMIARDHGAEISKYGEVDLNRKKI